MEAVTRLAERAQRSGKQVFGAGWRSTRMAVAPGRVELIGNHTDYNGGPVLCAAIDRWIVVLADAEASSSTVRVIGADVSAVESRPIQSDDSRDWRSSSATHDVADYVQGAVAAILGRADLTLRTGTRMAIAGNVPLGFGVSSSAALCVASVLTLSEERPFPRDLVLLAQEAEHRAGTPCGRMDQSASVHGGVIRFDGRTTESAQRHPDLGDLVFAVMDSGVARALSDSAYPTRVREAEMARAAAEQVLGRPLDVLADISPQDLPLIEDAPTVDPRLVARIRHVVTECDRVDRADAAMQIGDWETFGALMDASGRSSAVDYAISHPRVEQLVAEARAVPGVLGARMMGGGEGGAAICLVRQDAVPALESALDAGYFREHGIAGKAGLVQPCTFSAGASLREI